MITPEVFRKMALALPDAEELPHFDKASFRIKKKIFATLDVKKNSASFKLSPEDQSVFSAIDKVAIYPVPNKWGQQGWTIVQLDNIAQDLLSDLLQTAYQEVRGTLLKK